MRILLAFLLFSGIGYAQYDNDWRTITSMNFVTGLAFEDGDVWVASTGGMYRFDPVTRETIPFTNVDGLHSVEVSSILKDAHDQVVIGGKDGFIQTYHIAEGIWRDVYLFEDNGINDMALQGDTLWVATEEGASQFLWNGEKYLFKGFFRNFTVLVNDFNAIEYAGDRVWLGTDQGVLVARGNSNTLEDPGQWKVISEGNGLPGNNVRNLSIIDGILWVAANKGIASIDMNRKVVRDSVWGPKAADAVIGSGDTKKILKTYQNANSKIWYTEQYDFIPGADVTLERSYQRRTNILTMDSAHNIWFGFDGDGILKEDWDRPFRLDGPGQNAIRYIIRDGAGNVWASSGKFKLTPNLGFSLYDGENWTIIDFRSTGWSNLGNTDVMYEDRFGTVWLGSWGGGLMNYSAGTFNYFHSYTGAGTMLLQSQDSASTRTLQDTDDAYKGFFSAVPNSDNYEIITTIKEDPSGRIWFGNYWPSNGRYLASAPFDENGSVSLDKSKWVYFGVESNLNVTQEESGISCMEFDDFGRIWIGTFKNGLYVLDYRGTLSEKNDDGIIHLTINDRLYSNEVRSLEKDNDGIIWIGTNGGLNSSDGVYVNNTMNIFRHIGDIEGLAGPLDSRINHITVDRYNNKWISTSAGLSILRADRSPWDSTGWVGYNTANSALVDNLVHGVYVDHKSLEAYIATEKGISVFSGSFAQIQEEYTDVEAGPNPFVLDGRGRQLVITKLRSNSTVRILSLNGQLIRELTSANGLVTGSRAIWDGRDRFGDEVSSGIYLFLAYTGDGKSTAGKIAVIRK